MVATCAGSLFVLLSQPAAADQPRARILYPGDLIGVVGDAVVIDAATATKRGRDLQIFDARDGRSLSGSSQLARVFGTRPPFGSLRAVGRVLLGTTPDREGSVTVFDPRANIIRFRVPAAARAYTRTFPPVAPRLLAAVGERHKDTLMIGVAERRGPCAVAIEARDVRGGRVLWRRTARAVLGGRGVRRR